MYETNKQKIRRLAAERDQYQADAEESRKTTAAALTNQRTIAATNSRLCVLIAEYIVAGQQLGDRADARALADSIAEAAAIEGIDLSIELSRARQGTAGVREPLHIDGAPVVPVTPSRQLYLVERARQSLAEQLAVVQASNDVLCREAVDRARNLAAAEPPAEVAW